MIILTSLNWLFRLSGLFTLLVEDFGELICMTHTHAKTMYAIYGVNYSLHMSDGVLMW